MKMRSNKIALLSVVLALLVLAVPLVYAPCPCPCPGKVTGGGQIRCRCDPNVRASFGFNIVCHRGDIVPKGELQYVDHTMGMFDTAPMQVHGHDMLSLEVWDKESPSKKARFQGECTIDHESGYTFCVYVEDNGEPGKNDVFVIKLFDGAHNQIYEARGEPILHGNIQIHKKP